MRRRTAGQATKHDHARKATYHHQTGPEFMKFIFLAVRTEMHRTLSVSGNLHALQASSCLGVTRVRLRTMSGRGGANQG